MCKEIYVCKARDRKESKAMKSQSESDVKRDWLSVRQHSVCVATCRRRAPSSACQSNPRQVERIVCGLYAANWGRCGTMVRQSEIKLKHAHAHAHRQCERKVFFSLLHALNYSFPLRVLIKI